MAPSMMRIRDSNADFIFDMVFVLMLTVDVGNDREDLLATEGKVYRTYLAFISSVHLLSGQAEQ